MVDKLKPYQRVAAGGQLSEILEEALHNVGIKVKISDSYFESTGEYNLFKFKAETDSDLTLTEQIWQYSDDYYKVIKHDGTLNYDYIVRSLNDYFKYSYVDAEAYVSDCMSSIKDGIRRPYGIAINVCGEMRFKLLFEGKVLDCINKYDYDADRLDKFTFAEMVKAFDGIKRFLIAEHIPLTLYRIRGKE